MTPIASQWILRRVAGNVRNGEVRPGPRVKEFVQQFDKLNLDVATIVGIHGDQASLQATREAAKK